MLKGAGGPSALASQGSRRRVLVREPLDAGDEDQLAACLGEDPDPPATASNADDDGGGRKADGNPIEREAAVGVSWGPGGRGGGGGGGWGQAGAAATPATAPPLLLPCEAADTLTMRLPAVHQQGAAAAASFGGFRVSVSGGGGGGGVTAGRAPAPLSFGGGDAAAVAAGAPPPTSMMLRPLGAPLYQMELDGGALAAAATAGATTPPRPPAASLSSNRGGGGGAAAAGGIESQRAVGPTGISLHLAAIESINVSLCNRNHSQSLIICIFYVHIFTVSVLGAALGL